MKTMQKICLHLIWTGCIGFLFCLMINVGIVIGEGSGKIGEVEIERWVKALVNDKDIVPHVYGKYRRDAFIYYALRPAYYYQALGLKKDEDFEKLIDWNKDDKDLKSKSVIGSLSLSKVVKMDQLIIRSPTRKRGFLWNSEDMYIGVSEAGKPYYWIKDGLPNIDPVIGNGDIIYCANSCVVCHVKGVIPFKDDIRTLAGIKELKVHVNSKEDADKIERPLPFIEDQKLYNNWVTGLTGYDGETVIKEYVRICRKYEEPLDTVGCAVEMEMGVEEFRKKFNDVEELLPVIFGDIKIRRDKWEKMYMSLRKMK
jgi:hypothetical protein